MVIVGISVLAIGIAVYIHYKNTSSSSGSSSSTPVTTARGAVSTGGGTSSSSSGSSTTSPALSGLVRALRPGDTYDASHSGIPVTSSPGSNNVFVIPYGAQVSVLGNPVTGPTSPQGTNAYYQVSYNGQTGYVSSFDLPTVYQQTPPPGGSVFGTAVLAQRQRRIAPNRSGSTTLVRNYKQRYSYHPLKAG